MALSRVRLARRGVHPCGAVFEEGGDERAADAAVGAGDEGGGSLHIHGKSPFDDGATLALRFPSKNALVGTTVMRIVQ